MRRLHISFSGKAMWFVVLFIFLGLTGCGLFSKQRIKQQSEFPYKVAGAKDREIVTMQARFRKYGVRVITIGQDYMISVPSSALFAEESPRIKWESYAILNSVACYLKQFRKIAVNVTAFSNKCVSAKRDRALTQARARAVGDYIWSQGIDSRFVFTQGLGSDKPIVSITGDGDKSPNSRVEITFRDAVA